jgi:hypothetical protein
LTGVLRVSDDGLQLLAAYCEAMSARLVAATPVPSVGLPTQATSGAVGTAYVALGGAVTALAGRVQTSGAEAAAAGVDFVVTDDAAAHDLGAIGGRIDGV